MRNRGFTLAELLGVLVILGVISLIAIPAVTSSIKNSKEESYKVQLEQIEKNAKDWSLKNTDSLPTTEGGTVSITLGQLKQGGFTEINIRNPKTGELFPNDMIITIVRQQNNYVYYVNTETGTQQSGEIDKNAPVLILNGNYLEYAEYTTSALIYQDPGVIAKTSTGEEIPSSRIVKQYKVNDREVSDVLTNSFTTYTITYSVTDQNITSQIIRTVIVRDTTPPELTIPNNVTLTLAQLTGFRLMDGVSAIDNSGINVTLTSSGNIANIPGEYIITYTATDAYQNVTSKKRIITVIP